MCRAGSVRPVSGSTVRPLAGSGQASATIERRAAGFATIERGDRSTVPEASARPAPVASRPRRIPATIERRNAAPPVSGSTVRADSGEHRTRASRPAKTLTAPPDSGDRSTVRRPLPKTGVFAPLFSTVKHETPILQGRKRPAVAFRGIFTRRNTPAPILSGHCQRASRPAKTLTENPNRAACLSGKPSATIERGDRAANVSGQR